MILNQDFKWQFTSFASSKYISTFTMEIKIDAIESGVMGSKGRTDAIAFVLCAHPTTIDTDTLVTVASNSRSWIVFFSTEFTWTFMSFKTLAIMEILSFRAVTAIDTVVIITVVGLIPTCLWAR